MSDEAFKEVLKLIEKEMVAANEKFELNHSDHESFAVLNEEVDKVVESTAEIENRTDELWWGIRRKISHKEIRKSFSCIYSLAIKLALEAMQVAAMAQKGILSNIEFEKQA